MNKTIWILFGIMLCPVFSISQNLLDMFTDSVATKQYVEATFKTSRIVLGQSVQCPAKGNLRLTISHHFGKINEGIYTFFGLDQSTIRLGLDYGVSDRLTLGIGRSTYQKNVDGLIKYKIARQQSGKGFPLTISYFGSININGLKDENSYLKFFRWSRFSFVNQLLIARKINAGISLQLAFSHIHYNLVKKIIDQNDIFAAGIGGRMKLSKRTSINAEYHALLPGQTAQDFYNSLSLGLDMETGGHVFQLFFTNSYPIFERGFIAETGGSWTTGDIYFGFNITRTFVVFSKKTDQK